MKFKSVDPLNINAATTTLPNSSIFAPIGGTATGMFGDFAQFAAPCAANGLMQVVELQLLLQTHCLLL